MEANSHENTEKDISTFSTVDKKAGAENVLPPEGDKYLGFNIFKILDEILEDKDKLGLPDKWRRFYELRKNKHWRTKSNSRVTLATANLLHTHISRTVNLLTDNNPTFNMSMVDPDSSKAVLDKDEDGLNLLDKLHKAAEFWWNETEQQHELEKSVMRGEIYGATIEKIIWNPSSYYGLGDAETVIVDPFHFGWWPVKSKPEDALVNIHFYPMTVVEARQKWPHMAEHIISDDEYLDRLADDRREVQGNLRPEDGRAESYMSTVSGVAKRILNKIGGKAGAESDGGAELLIVECWVRDYTTETVEVAASDEDSIGRVHSVVAVETRPKYPGFIRCVTTCNGGNIILSDRPNPNINPDHPLETARKTYLFSQFPFTVTPSNTDPENSWGMSDFEQLDNIQHQLDKALSQFTTAKDKASGLKVINPKGSGVPDSHLGSNSTGVIKPANHIFAQAIKYLEPPSVSREIVRAIDIYKDLFFLVAGTFDLDSAASQGSNVIAYKAIAALIERAATMLKGKIRNYSRMIRNRGRMYISMLQNFYSDPRWVSYSGQDGKEHGFSIIGTELAFRAKLGVVSGSTLPVSKVQQREEAINLFQLGAIDHIELLKYLEWPSYVDVVGRMQAGPIGEFVNKLAIAGMPPQLLELLKTIAGMDEKELKNALGSGEIPGFNEVFTEMLKMASASAQNGEQEPDPEQQERAVEVARVSAEIEKTKAETRRINQEAELSRAKTETERMIKIVKEAGIQFDKEKIKIEKAQTTVGIQMQELRQELASIRKKFKTGFGEGPERDLVRNDMEQEGVRHEKGLSSNNEEAGEE